MRSKIPHIINRNFILRTGGLITIVFDIDATAFITATGITDNTQKTAINRLVLDLKNASLWTKMIAVYPFVGGTTFTHKFNLINPQDTDAAFRIVWGGTVTHTLLGIQGDGTSGWGDTKINPSLVLTTGSAHHSIYSRTTTALGNCIDYGVSVFANATSSYSGEMVLYARYLDNICYNDMWGNSAALGRTASTAQTDALGLYITNRNSLSSNKTFKKGIELSNNTTTLTTPQIPNANIYICAQHYKDTATTDIAQNNSSRQFAFYSVGSGLLDTEAVTLNTIVETYQTALSRLV